MDVTVESTSAVKRKVTITIEAGEVSRAWRQAVRKVAGQVRIPGFRPGKAPGQLIERRYGAAIREDVLEKLLGKAVPEAIEAEGIDAISQPELQEVGELRDGESLTAAFVVEVLPELEIALPDGDAITADAVEPDDEDLRLDLAEICAKHAAPADVDGPAESGDEIAVSMRILAKDAAPEEERELRHLVVDEPGVAAWLNEAVMGRRVGETLDVDFDMADDEAHPLAGQPCHLDGEITSIKRTISPELDDALAAKEGLDTLAALRERSAALVATRAERRTQLFRRRAAVNWLLDNREIPVPAALIEREVWRQMEQMFGGKLPRENAQLMGRLRELGDHMRPEAERHVKEALLVRHLGESQKIEISDEDVQGRLQEMAAEMGDQAEQLLAGYDSDDGRAAIRGGMLEEAALDAALAGADVRIARILRLRDKPEELDAAEAAKAAEAAAEAEAAEAAEAAADAEVTGTVTEPEAAASADAEAAATADAAPTTADKA